jgi:hypothetical protein
MSNIVKIRELPAVEYLRDVFDYNPKTGALIWRERPKSHFRHSVCANPWKSWNTSNAGKEAGHVRKSGELAYRIVGLDGRLYRAHRICYAIYYGMHPVFTIDHIDGVGTHNWITNLREAPGSVNQRNTKMNIFNASGVNGVCFNKMRKKWLAYIEIKNKRKWLGSFSTKEEAAKARKAAEVGYGFTERHGTHAQGVQR